MPPIWTGLFVLLSSLLIGLSHLHIGAAIAHEVHHGELTIQSLVRLPRAPNLTAFHCEISPPFLNQNPNIYRSVLRPD